MAACTNPAGDAGEMLYNADHAVFQWCDGTQWIGFPRPELADTTSGRIAHWEFEEGSGTTAADSVGSNNGTLSTNSGVSWTTGKIGGALEFDGAGDGVTVPHDSSQEITDAITLAVWVYPTADGQLGFSRIISKRNDSGGSDTYALGIEQGNDVAFRIILEGGLVHHNSGAVVSLNQWTHLAATYDGTNIRIYINGVEDVNSPASASGDLTTSTVPLRLGSRYGEEELRRFEGRMDDVRVYGRALSAAEIGDLYDLGSGGGQNVTNGLVAHWELDEASGGVAADSSGNNNDGYFGPYWVDGNVGEYALAFDGGSGYVDVGTGGDTALQYPMTITAWVNKADSEEFPAVVARDTDLSNRQFQFRIGDGNRLNFTAYPNGDGTGQQSFFGSKVWGAGDVGQWRFVAVTVNATGSLKLYVNGVEDGSGTVTDFTVPGISGPTRIGASGHDGTYFNGVIDDVRIYSRALSEAEIEALYETGSAGAGCEAGQILYNADHAVFQWCDGMQWIGFRKPGSSSGDEVTDGLVGWWKLDEGGGTTAADSAGSNDGTLVNGPVWKLESDCQVGQCLEFDGTNHVNVDGDQQALTMIEEMTIAFWAKPDNLSNQDIMGKEGGASARSYKIAMRDYVLAGGIEWLVASDATNQVGAYSITTGLSAGIWQHIAVTFKANEYMQIYINGVQVDSAESGIIPSQSFLDNGVPHRIGAKGNSSGSYSGALDDVRIYDRALSEEEIETIYNCGSGGPCGEESPCSDPGHMLYNADFDVLQWCDGENWIGLPKPE